MAETALSITTSVGALLALATKIVFTINDVRDAPVTILNVSKEVSSLHAILLQLNFILQSDSQAVAPLPPQVAIDLENVLQNCFDIKLDLWEILNPYFKSAGRGLRLALFRWSSWKWALWKEKEVEKMRNTLETHKTTLGLTLLIISNITAQQLMQNTGEITEDVARVLSTMGMVSANVEDIKDLIRQLSTQIKDNPEGFLHFGPHHRTKPEEVGVMLQRYLNSAATFVDSASYIDSASRHSPWLSTERGTTHHSNPVSRANSILRPFAPSTGGSRLHNHETSSVFRMQPSSNIRQILKTLAGESLQAYRSEPVSPQDVDFSSIIAQLKADIDEDTRLNEELRRKLTQKLSQNTPQSPDSNTRNPPPLPIQVPLEGKNLVQHRMQKESPANGDPTSSSTNHSLEGLANSVTQAQNQGGRSQHRSTTPTLELRTRSVSGELMPPQKIPQQIHPLHPEVATSSENFKMLEKSRSTTRQQKEDIMPSVLAKDISDPKSEITKASVQPVHKLARAESVCPKATTNTTPTIAETQSEAKGKSPHRDGGSGEPVPSPERLLVQEAEADLPEIPQWLHEKIEDYVNRYILPELQNLPEVSPLQQDEKDILIAEMLSQVKSLVIDLAALQFKFHQGVTRHSSGIDDLDNDGDQPQMPTIATPGARNRDSVLVVNNLLQNYSGLMDEVVSTTLEELLPAIPSPGPSSLAVIPTDDSDGSGDKGTILGSGNLVIPKPVRFQGQPKDKMHKKPLRHSSKPEAETETNRELIAVSYRKVDFTITELGREFVDYSTCVDMEDRCLAETQQLRKFHQKWEDLERQWWAERGLIWRAPSSLVSRINPPRSEEGALNALRSIEPALAPASSSGDRVLRELIAISETGPRSQDQMIVGRKWVDYSGCLTDADRARVEDNQLREFHKKYSEPPLQQWRIFTNNRENKDSWQLTSTMLPERIPNTYPSQLVLKTARYIRKSTSPDKKSGFVSFDAHDFTQSDYPVLLSQNRLRYLVN